MNPSPETSPVYVKCQRCGAQIPEQSAIEEDGLLLCGECLVAEVKRNVSKAEAEAEHQRHEQRRVDHDKLRREQRRRALLILSVCVTGLILALGLTHMNKADPVPTRSLNSVEHPDIVRSMLLIGIYKYQSEHGTPPETLKDLVPMYLNAELTGAFEHFEYAVAGKGYTLELKKPPAMPEQLPQEEDTQRDEL